MLIVMAGLPGTGKSTIATELAKRLDGLVLSKDEIRARLFPREKIEYSREQDDLCISVVFLIADYVHKADQKKAVLIDGRTFSKQYQIESLLLECNALKLKPAVIECTCDDRIVKERLEKDRQRGDHPAGNRTYGLYRELRENADALTIDRLIIDTGREPVEESVQRALIYINFIS